MSRAAEQAEAAAAEPAPEADRRGRIIAGPREQPDAQPVRFLFSFADQPGVAAEIGQQAALDARRIQPGAMAENVMGEFVRKDGGQLVLIRDRFGQPAGDLDTAPIGVSVELARRQNKEASRAALFGADPQQARRGAAAAQAEKRGAVPEGRFESGPGLFDAGEGAVRGNANGGQGRAVRGLDGLVELEPGPRGRTAVGQRQHRRAKRAPPAATRGRRILHPQRHPRQPLPVRAPGDIGDGEAMADRHHQGVQRAALPRLSAGPGRAAPGQRREHNQLGQDGFHDFGSFTAAYRLLTENADSGQAPPFAPSPKRLVQMSNTSIAPEHGANFRVVNEQALWQSGLSQLKGEFTMSFKKATVVALLAASMSSAPVLAQTTASASAPTVAAGESTESASELRGGFIIPLIAIVAVILGIVAAVGGNDEGPRSP